MSHVAHLNESRHIRYETTTNHIVSERVSVLISATIDLAALINSHVAPMSHVAHMHLVAHMNESRRTYE